MKEVERDGDCSEQGLFSGTARVPLLLKQATLEEEVTGCKASLKLAAPGEQDGQAEGTAAGTAQ